MRIGVATVYTPSVTGGAELLAEGLCTALAEAGHSVHRFVAPFSYASLAAQRRSMALWEGLDFDPFDGGGIDRMIALKWPAYLLRHPNTAVWMLHQHRPAYDLFDTPYGFSGQDQDASALRDRIREADAAALGRLTQLFTISQRVCERLRENNGLASSAVYHPPDSADVFYCAPAHPYVLAPSRLESLKRQSLLLEAMSLAASGLTAVIVGEGGDRIALERLAEKLDIQDRVRFLGAVPRRQLIELYARAAAVFFGPRDEDYGYVTLEAMLAAKPVITCVDSGGPLEFVVDGETGWIVAPDAEAVAGALGAIAADPAAARGRGAAGLARYQDMGISWRDAVERLTACVDAPAGARDDEPARCA